MRNFSTLLFFIVTTQLIHAQITPADGDTLNYTQVLFSFPSIKTAEKYTIQISENSEFNQNTVVSMDINAGIISTLSFGLKYYWRYAGVDKKGATLEWKGPFVFHTGNSQYTDTSLYHYRGKRKSRTKCAPGLLFMDYGRAAVNRIGKAIWYLPEFSFLAPNELVRDLKLTPEGTITGLIDSVACEITLDGKIIWQAPDGGKINGEKSENYHHDLKKLPNGNYMVLGNDHVYRYPPDGSDSIELEFGTIIEYDPSGKIVWSWNSNSYFTDQDLFCRRRPDGTWDAQTHMNAFSTDGKVVVAGFRDISRIIVIDKSTGKVIASYGAACHVAELHGAAGFFRRQHDAIVLRDGNFAVINNDSVMDPSVVSSLVVFSPVSATQKESFKRLEFKFNFDTLTNGKSARMGNLQELSNGNLLINMGALHRCVEITNTGEVVWDMFIERYDTLQKKWVPFPQYRVSYTSSLYPYEFRTRLLKDETVNNVRTISIKLYNIGDQQDNYTAQVNDKEGNNILIGMVPNVTLKPGESYQINMKVKSSQGGTVRVNSGHSLKTETIVL